MTHWLKVTYKLTELTNGALYAKLPPFRVTVDDHPVEIAFHENQTADAIAQAKISDGLAAQLEANEWSCDKWSQESLGVPCVLRAGLVTPRPRFRPFFNGSGLDRLLQTT